MLLAMKLKCFSGSPSTTIEEVMTRVGGEVCWLGRWLDLKFTLMDAGVTVLCGRNFTLCYNNGSINTGWHIIPFSGIVDFRSNSDVNRRLAKKAEMRIALFVSLCRASNIYLTSCRHGKEMFLLAL